jgi:hypothetical protein
MEILVVKLVCVAVLVAIFGATIWLTPWLYGVRRDGPRAGRDDSPSR